MRSLTPVLAVALLAVAARSQATHVVGPNGFAQINAALAVAAPGDVLVVDPGIYEPFAVTFGVTIRAATPGTVLVNVAIVGALVSSTVTLAANETVHLVDLSIRVLTISGGTTTLDGCTLTAYQFWGTTAVSLANGILHCHACTFLGGQGSPGLRAGLAAVNATVSAVDSSFTGANAGHPLNGPPAGAAVVLQNSTLQGSRLTALGGSGTVALAYPPQPALRATTSIVWTSDSTLTGGAYPNGTRVCPVDANAGRLARCTLVPTCPAGIPSGLLLGVHRVAAPQAAGTLGLEFQTDANGYVAIFASNSLGTSPLPALEQPLLLDAANAFPVAFLLADASGQAAVTWTIPAGITHAAWWFQGVSGPTFPLQLSPVVGGIVR